MNWAAEWNLTVTIAVFCASTLVILVVGIRLARVSDQLADVTGLGEALFGAALLGGSTSLPGIIASVTAAASDHPELAVSNAVGGIAAQTAFIALADMAYRKVNLEHAAASAENLVNGTVLCALLGVVLLATAGPQWTLFSIHPASFLLLGGYAFGLRLAAQTHDAPAWKPVQTTETDNDEPDDENLDSPNLPKMWSQFAIGAVLVGTAGYFVGISGIGIVRSTGLSESVVGGLFTAVATSLPELVTAIAAVRQGAPNLAVGVIIGGNAFDVLFIAFSDIAYREGSIYGAVGAEPQFIVSLTIVLTSILLLGLLRRQKQGPGNIGLDGVAILVFYLGGFALLARGYVG